MSQDGEKAAVFRTTKVRTKLKGDRSWLQQRSDSQSETTDQKVRTKLKEDSSWLQQQNQPKAAATAPTAPTAAASAEEKPWMAELRSCRQNGDEAETSPAASPTKSAEPLAKPEPERTPTSGFLIRGIFTKLDSPTSPSPPNTFGGSTQFIKKPSESYKKIAPHTVKSSVENQETQLSEEQQQKRKEAASNVLKQSAARQRSYVLSAAKMFESQDGSEPSLDKNNQSFVATRVEIIDDESPGSTAPVASAPQPKPRKIASVDEELAAPKKEATPEPVKEAPPLVPVTQKDPFEHMKPGCTKVDTPLPELSLECVQSGDEGTKTEDSQLSGQTDEAPVKLAPEAPTILPPVAAPPTAVSSVPEILDPVSATALPVPESPAPVSATALPVPESPAPVSTTPESPTPTSPIPEPTILESAAAAVIPESPAPVSVTMDSPAPALPVPEQTTPESTAPTLDFLESLAPGSTTPESPTPTSPIPEPTVLESTAAAVVIPESPAPVSVTMDSPAPALPVPEQTTPESTAPTLDFLGSLAPASTTPESPTPTSPAPEPTILESTAAAVIPESPAPVSATMDSPAPAVPVPEQTTPESTAPTLDFLESLAPASTTPESPTPTAPAPEPTILESTAAAVIQESPAPVSATTESPAPTTPTPEPAAPEPTAPAFVNFQSPAPESANTESPSPTAPLPESQAAVSFVQVPPVPTGREITEETKVEPSLHPSSRDDTLAVLSDTLISFDTSSSSLKDDEPAPVETEASPEKHADGARSEEAPTPELSNCVPVTEDLLEFTSGPEEPPRPTPPSPGRWSLDLLGDLGGESGRTLDVDDVVFIRREAPGLNVEPEEEKEAEGGTQSSTETVTTTTKTVIIIDKGVRMDPEPWSSSVKTTVVQSSLADPFDPYPIGTTAPNSSADLLQPDSDISINSVSMTHMEEKDPGTSMSSTALEFLADDVIPINTDTTRLSTRRSWARTWDTGTSEQSQEAGAGDGDQKMFVMFERKSAENDSPWDRWTSPTVYTITTEEEEEERPKDTQTEAETVTTVTTIREIRSEPEPAMDHYGAYSRTLMEEDQRVQTPSPEAKKPFVYVKEYINTTASSLHSTSGSDYSYSGSASSTCTYCGEPVGNDARITIDHLNVNSHPHCFKCAVCSKPMGDLLDSMFIHGGKVNCESCYSRAFD